MRPAHPQLEVTLAGTPAMDEATVRLVEQMRQFFSLADYLPVGEDATTTIGELSERKKPANRER